MKVVLAVVLLLHAALANEDLYGHTEGEQQEWAETPTCASGTQQSPIDLPKSEEDGSCGAHGGMKFTGPGAIVMTAINNGHTAQFNFGGNNYTVSKGPFGGKYVLDQVHFHFGKDKGGSEHSVDGKKYPMEIHLVHHRKNFETLGEAVKSNQKHALAVIGIFADTEGEARQPASLAHLVGSLSRATHEAHPVSAGNVFDPYNLVPEEGGYYTYDGSLTTPPCAEVVHWVVMKKPIKFCSKLLEKFAKLRKFNKEKIEYNWRPTSGRTESGRDVTQCN